MKTEARYYVDGLCIKDRDGRTVILRGCNLGGDSKIPFTPAGNPLSYDVSFSGRPFPIEEADEHFSRLARWGFLFLRLVITWEAVEHAGPGIYDEEYLSYLREILKKAETYGISVCVDPHQDAWSRWTGGDGAPGWTLEAVGFDLGNIAASGAAFTTVSEGSSYKMMSWPLNYLRYANATMWTLFFGGSTYAPSMLVEGVPVQEWLQDHFIGAMKHTARRLKDCAAVAGFGTLNEPHPGFIGLESLDAHQRVTAPEGLVPTAFEAIASASGFPQKIRYVKLGGKITVPHSYVLNPAGVPLFRNGFECPWKSAGVWKVEDGKPVVVRDAHFSCRDFGEEHLKPFQMRFIEAVSKKHEQYLFFVEGVPMGMRSRWTAEDRIRSDGTPLSIVEAFHWYDAPTLLFKKWRPWLAVDGETARLSIGPGAAARSAREQLDRLAGYPRGEGIPAMLGEFGTPFDLDRGASYRTGSYAAQEEALGCWYDAIDASLLHSTLWTYAASNTHEKGDGWNTEDLSIYSSTTKDGRGVRGFSRPYALAVSGDLVRMSFDRHKRIFELEWAAVDGVTEVFVPTLWYPEGWRACFEGENAELEELPDDQRLLVRVRGIGADGGTAVVRVIPSPDGE